MWKRLDHCTELEMEKILGNLLRAGVIMAAVVVLAGLILHFIAPESTPLNYRVFRGEPTELRNVRGILQDALDRRGSGVIQLGLLLLLATPVARVALSVLAFVCQRDKVYVLVTLIVLSVLVYSMTGGSL